MCYCCALSPTSKCPEEKLLELHPAHSCSTMRILLKVQLCVYTAETSICCELTSKYMLNPQPRIWSQRVLLEAVKMCKMPMFSHIKRQRVEVCVHILNQGECARSCGTSPSRGCVFIARVPLSADGCRDKMNCRREIFMRDQAAVSSRHCDIHTHSFIDQRKLIFHALHSSCYHLIQISVLNCSIKSLRV